MGRDDLRFRAVAVIAGGMLGVIGTAVADEEQPRLKQGGGDRQITLARAEDRAVEYPAEFFDRYEPRTALNMVRQVPGFQINDGDETRGFGGAAGNVLLNGRRPSTKQDSPSEILGRIPASQVAYIELIRGELRGIDLRGHSVVANVVLRDDPPAATQWEVSGRHNFDVSPLTFEGTISHSDLWADIEYNVGIHLRRARSGEDGTEDVLEGDGVLIEERFESLGNESSEGSGNLNASTWLGETLLQFNAELMFEEEDVVLTSRRVPQAPGSPPHDEIFGDQLRLLQIEVGADAERELGRDLRGKAILLFIREDEDLLTSQRVVDVAGQQTLFRAGDAESVETEGIARLEFDWLGLLDHSIQADLEGAYNVLDSALDLIEDTGAGPVSVPVPSANTRVEEIRWNILLKDTWSLGRFDLDYGLGAEYSTLSQTGDVNQERSFFFLKPQAALTFAPTQERQTRLRLAREVGQLDFEDFASATVFEDDDLALGNPNLRPESTWIAELSHERRFGRRSVVRLIAFHHWISDLVDLLPLTPTIEVPGNIGDGRRWGVKLETSMPLDAMGLTGAVLDFKARWQDSVVEDPVTGRDRVLSSGNRFDKDPIPFDDENEYAVLMDYRQDFEPARVAWGWDVGFRAERPRFKVNELDIFDDGVDLNAFVETTRWFGLKFRLEGQNLLNLEMVRDRTVFVGERGLSTVAFRELMNRTDGTRVVLSVSGTF